MLLYFRSLMAGNPWNADPAITQEPKSLGGLRFSAVLLVLLGALLGIYVPLYSFMLAVILYKRLHGVHFPNPSITSLVLTIAGATTLSFLCFRAGAALSRSRKWAAYVAIAWGLLLFYFGSRIMIDLFRPYQPGAVQGEDLFGFLIAVPCIAVGAWWCVYLILPHVRSHLQSS
jgi:hypothetical protein